MKRHIPLILLLLVGTFAVQAQDRLKFSIDEFAEDQFDAAAIDRQWEKYDGNGDRYAIVKVTSVNPNDKLNEYTFDFGMQMSLDCRYDLDERWIYVEKYAKYVTVTRNGYIPLKKVPLNTTIQPGKVYTLRLNSEAPVLNYQMVQFNVTPSNAKAMIFVKNNLTEEETTLSTDDSGSAADSFLFGSYSYRVVAPNYHQSDGVFELNDKLETKVETVKLRPNFSEVTLMAAPGVEIYVNGQLYGTGSWAGRLKSGNYTVECRKENHVPTRETLAIQDHDDRTFNLELPTPITGILSINSQPLGAKILIDGQDYGVTPKNIDVVVGTHSVVVSKENHRPESQTVDVVKDQTQQLNFALSNVGNVVISTVPARAAITIDGERMKGTSPLNYEGEIGEHTLRLTCDGYMPFSKKFSVQSGERANLIYTMTKSMVKKNSVFAEVGFDVGSVMGPKVTVGGTVANVMLQAGFEYGLGKSETIYWNTADMSRYFESRYSPSIILSGAAGYNVTFANRFGVAPLVGFRYTGISSSGDYGVNKTYCGSMTFGVRAFVGIIPYVGVSVTPTYYMKVAAPSGYNDLAALSSKIKGFGSGFSCTVALCVNF